MQQQESLKPYPKYEERAKPYSLFHPLLFNNPINRRRTTALISLPISGKVHNKVTRLESRIDMHKPISQWCAQFITISSNIRRITSSQHPAIVRQSNLTNYSIFKYPKNSSLNRTGSSCKLINKHSSSISFFTLIRNILGPSRRGQLESSIMRIQ